MLKTGFTILMLVAVTGCNTPPPAPAVDVAAETGKLRDDEAAWVKEAAAKDLDKIVAHYTDDAVLMGPGMPAAKGKDAIRAAWKGVLDASDGKLQFGSERVEVGKSGDLATTRGAYTMIVTNPKTKKSATDKGNYVTVYQKQADGGWKVVEDIFVSEIPPPAPK